MVKEPLLWLGSLPQHGFDPGPRNFHIPQVQPKQNSFIHSFFFFYARFDLPDTSATLFYSAQEGDELSH